MDIRLTSIDKIQLSPRSANALRRAGIHTVGDLLEQTEESLRKIRNLGTKSIEEILQKSKNFEKALEGATSTEPAESIPTSTDPRELSIEEIHLSVRSTNALKQKGILTVRDLLKQTEESLMSIPNLGVKSVDEILAKAEEYQNNIQEYELVPRTETSASFSVPKDFDKWISDENNQQWVITWLKNKQMCIEDLEGLSVRAFNDLMFAGYDYVYQIAFLSEEEILGIRRMDAETAMEIVSITGRYISKHKDDILAAFQETLDSKQKEKIPSIYDLRFKLKYRKAVWHYITNNDIDIQQTTLSTRSKNSLVSNGYTKLSDIYFLKREELNLRALGAKSLDEITAFVDKYSTEHENRMIAYVCGDEAALLDDSAIRKRILELYQDIGFGGLSLGEMTERLELPEYFSLERLKSIIGALLAEKKLEYVDFRCHRIYERFEDFLERCTSINERNREFIKRRLHGDTLEAIGQQYGLTRERVRQIVLKEAKKVRTEYYSQTGMKWFDEDYFQYFYTTYSFDRKDGAEWLGIPDNIWNYLDLYNEKRGKKKLNLALDDRRNLEAGLRLKISNYLHRDQLLIEGVWVEKKRSALENAVVRKFCKEDVTYDAFIRIYNSFLEEQDVPYDEGLYITDATYQTRKNRLSDARCLLWKQNERIRYYDVDGQDYDELLDTLNLESYEDIEISTSILMRNHPEIMEKYDIRDQYELHNLLRKIVPVGSYHDFHCNRMPMIEFGTFDRSSAILDILMEYAPISSNALAEHISQKYGYEKMLVQANYLQPFSAYLHQGIYSIDQKAMTYEHRNILKAALTEDFYFIDEIRKIYIQLVPEASVEEVNPYNLKNMGFLVFSGHALQNYPTLDAYFTDILTRDDIVDITEYSKRYGYVQAFTGKLMELKRSLQIIEYEPRKYINYRKLENAGITREMIQDFCDAVYDFLEDGTYFSGLSLMQSEFESDLFDLGFSERFYASILLSDDRFSYGNMFGTIILYKGQKSITIKSFLSNRVQEYGCVDPYDLMTELIDRFGCKISDKSHVTSKLKEGTEVYHDTILDRLYANKEQYYMDLEGDY